MSHPVSDPSDSPIPIWLRALGVVAIAAIAAAATYAVAIGLVNFSRIGV